MSNQSPIERAVERYSEFHDLRAAINLIPGIGGSLDALFGGLGSEIAQRRVLHLANTLREEMEQLAESAVDKSFLESEEFRDLSLRAFEAASRTRHEEKVRWYAKILRKEVSTDGLRDDSAEAYINTLADLTLREILVAQALWNQQGLAQRNHGENDLQFATRMGWENLSDECPGISPEDLPFCLSRLERAGLVREVVGTFLDYEGGVFVVTYAFEKLMQNYINS
ncbi:MAG TPA: hypothetical protein VKA64_10005 [Gammaproteobacteria bacterium]|nr:hypothetical protein [Gammaproteobacteria bacterium]